MATSTANFPQRRCASAPAQQTYQIRPHRKADMQRHTADRSSAVRPPAPAQLKNETLPEQILEPEPFMDEIVGNDLSSSSRARTRPSQPPRPERWQTASAPEPLTDMSRAQNVGPLNETRPL